MDMTVKGIFLRQETALSLFAQSTKKQEAFLPDSNMPQSSTYKYGKPPQN